MHKLSCLAVVLAIAGVMDTKAQSADLEGAVQYSPPSIGKDAQPPAPAGMVQQPVSPRRIELGVSGSSTAPSVQRFYFIPSPRFGEPDEPRFQSGSGG